MSVAPASIPADLPAADLRKNEPRTAVEMWKRRVGKQPSAPAFRPFSGESWKTVSYAEADAAAQEIAAGLVAAGVVPGDRVCLVAQTRLEWALCDVGILLAGGVTVPIYGSNTAEQCEVIIRDAGAKLVIVEDALQRDKVLPLRDRLYTVTGMVQIADETPAGDFVRSLAALRASGRSWLEAQKGAEALDAYAE